MKKVFHPLFIVFCLAAFQCVAQTYVTIPDNNFVNWLTNAYPDCMAGNQMDIDCPGIMNATGVNVQSYNISNLTGIEYFTSLQFLNCGFNQLATLPELPSGLLNLTCYGNQLVSLPDLPESLIHFDCNGNPGLASISGLPSNLSYLATGGTSINLNNYTPLPESLIFLSIQGGGIYSELPSLPSNLETLFCGGNPIGELPPLPATLTNLACNNNQLTELPNPLPPNLEFLSCANNSLMALSGFPESLLQLQCQNNQIESIESFPSNMNQILAQDNALTSLPDLPAALTYLECQNNQLTSLPELPTVLNNLHCENNQLTSLPTIPQSMLVLNCSNNLITCFPPFPSALASPNILDNPFTCLPNYIPSMGVFGLLEYPLCEDGDLVNNPFGCSSAMGVTGKIYVDDNADCTMNIDESGMSNVTVRLLDDLGNFVSSTTSAGNGIYFLSGDTMSFTVEVDVLNKPYQVSCEDPGSSQDIDFTPGNQLIQDLNFGLECKPGFDIGVQGVLTTGWVFPGQEHELKVQAGDMSTWFGLDCAAGVSGEVVVTVNGPVSYSGAVAGALTPQITGDHEYTYTISDFSNVSFNQSFRLHFVTDTTAQDGDQVCVNISVTPTESDQNTANNNYQYCYAVVNSYDPNMKTVWPKNVEPGFDGYFNYTVYFQNTGNAPAFNIRIADTLDSQLDISTFEVVNYSHDMLTYLHGNVATFRFNSIMLPDSTTDFEGSIGFVQYRIKPLEDLPVGTIIENTAHIFFDFNEAIVTNTTENEFMILTSVQVLAEGPAMLVFPNPGIGLFTLEIEVAQSQLVHVEVFNLRGERLQQFSTMNDRTTLDLTEYPSGMYLVRAQNESGARHLKVVKH